MSALFETILDLNLEMVSPALENTLSAGADVAVMHRMRLANRAICGNLVSRCFHHCNGSLHPFVAFLIGKPVSRR